MVIRRALAALLGCIIAASAWGQSSPNFPTWPAFTPTATQWNGYFAGKVDTTNGVLNTPTLNNPILNGATYTGPQAFGTVTFGSGANATMTITPGATTANGVLLTTNSTVGFRFGASSGNSVVLLPNASPSGDITFLPGGSGRIDSGRWLLGNGVSFNIAQSGSTNLRMFDVAFTTSGSLNASGGFASWNRLLSASDSVSVTAVQGVGALEVDETAATGAGGDRLGAFVSLNIPVLVAANGGNQQHVAGLFTGSMSANQGGSSPTSGLSAGELFGINPNVILRNGATNTTALIGQETDVAIASGASTQQKTGMQIVETSADTAQGHDQDIAFLITNQNTTVMVGWRNAIAFGAQGAWPVDPAVGVLFETIPQSSEYVSSLVKFQLQAAKGLGGVWIDTMDVASNSGYSFRGDGFATDGAGQIFSSNAELGTTSTGIKLDIPNQIVTAISVNTAGGSATAPVYPGDEMYGLATGPYRGIYKVTHSQAVTGSFVAAGGSGGTNGTQTVTLSGGTCSTPPQFSVTVSGGAITSVNSVSTAGDCTAFGGSNNSNYGWPVTGAGLTGAQLSVAFGAKTMTIVVPDVSSSVPGTISLSDDGGANTRGTVISPTWSARQVLILNPSGDTVAGLGTQLGSLSATTGFFHLPYTNSTTGSGGIPTGTPASVAGPACVWNDVTFVMDCYSPSAGAWKHVAFSNGAG